MANLAKFGIPLDGTKLGILHPKQMYRFRIVWQNFGENNGLREMTANVVKVTRPKVAFGMAELHSYNSVGLIAGKRSPFEAIEVTLRDDITNAVVSSVGAQIQKQMNHFEQTSAVAGINYKFTMEIHSLDGTNNDQLESWVLDGCWLENVNYGEGDYSSGEPNLITLSVRFDNATQVAGPNTNDGTTVGGNPYPDTASPTGGTTFG
jgi:hypothetical protein